MTLDTNGPSESTDTSRNISPPDLRDRLLAIDPSLEAYSDMDGVVNLFSTARLTPTSWSHQQIGAIAYTDQESWDLVLTSFGTDVLKNGMKTVHKIAPQISGVVAGLFSQNSGWVETILGSPVYIPSRTED